MFTERPQGQGIVFVANHSPGTPLKNSIADGDTVTLHLGEEHVFIQGVTSLGSGRLKGVIYGFEPSFGVAYQELQLDQAVEFDESQVFGCG